MNDTLYMSQALALAERGRGRTSPNPMVGAVIVDAEGIVVGRGVHELAGGPHAEVHALADAGDRARGSTLYCTLEPCCHTGRTGPCAPLVVSSGIRRAVVAVRDPNPLVAGKGLAHLEEHGVQVTAGILEVDAVRLNAPFFTLMRQGRPFVTMKVAISRDGKVARQSGARTALTGPASNRLIHRERAEVDAVGVGSGTVLVDDPMLTARGAYRTRPLVRVVFDRSLGTSPSARMLSTLDRGAIIVVSTTPQDAAMRLRAEALRAAGARIEVIDDAAEGGFLGPALSRLAGLGVSSLVVEGGPTLHGALWAAGLVDRVQVFRTPWMLGAGGVPWLEDETFSVEDLRELRTVRLGEDVMVEGYVHRAD